VGASVLPKLGRLTYSLPIYDSSHFQQEWPYCSATAEKSHRCKIELHGTQGRGPAGKRKYR